MEKSSHINPPQKSISRPTCRMKKEWWQLLAVIHDMTESRESCTRANIVKRLGTALATTRTRLDSLRDKNLIESDWTIAPKERGSVTVYGLTNSGYAELFAFSHHVRSECDAQQYYSGNFRRLAA